MEENRLVVGYWNSKVGNYVQLGLGLLLTVGVPLAALQESTANQPFFEFLGVLIGVYLLKSLWQVHADYDIVILTADEIIFERRYRGEITRYEYMLSEVVAIEYFQLLQSVDYNQRSYYRQQTILFKDTNPALLQKWQKLNNNKRVSIKFKNNDIVQIRTLESSRTYVPSDMKKIIEFLQRNQIVVANSLIEDE